MTYFWISLRIIYNDLRTTTTMIISISECGSEIWMKVLWSLLIFNQYTHLIFWDSNANIQCFNSIKRCSVNDINTGNDFANNHIVFALLILDVRSSPVIIINRKSSYTEWTIDNWIQESNIQNIIMFDPSFFKFL